MESKFGLLNSSTLFKKRLTNGSYHFNHELNPNEKLIELKNKYAIIVI